MKSYPIISSLMVISILILSISSNPVQKKLTLTKGSRFDYVVVCTDYCGSKIWDATYLDADLFIIINEINTDNDQIAFYTAYNSTAIINRSYTSDYGFFSLNETFILSTGENFNKGGNYSWQMSNLRSELNVSIPYFFLAHTPSSFQNNTYTMHRITDNFELPLTPQQTFYGHEYRETWIYKYSTANSSVSVVSDLILIYDSTSGLLLRMTIEMQSTQEFTGPIPQDPNVEAIGSFKMILLIPSEGFVTALPLLFSLTALVVLLIIVRRVKY
jgi:hypothetical protein